MIWTPLLKLINHILSPCFYGKDLVGEEHSKERHSCPTLSTMRVSTFSSYKIVSLIGIRLKKTAKEKYTKFPFNAGQGMDPGEMDHIK